MNWNGIVSLLIASLEFFIILNLLFFIEKNESNKLILIIVFLLFGYQAFEFIICYFELRSPYLTFFAFVDISFLPPLLLIMILRFWNYNSKLHFLFLAPPVFFTSYYFYVVKEFVVAKCTVLYASYHYPLGDLYGLFYYGPLLASMILLVKKIKKAENQNKVHASKILLSALIFISIPVVTAFVLHWFGKNEMLKSIESIMCKSAFVLALSLFYFALKNGETKKIKLFF